MTLQKFVHSDKIKISPSCSCFSTIVLFKHLVFNKMPEEKARWELYQDAAYCFEQILEAAPYKTKAVLPLPISPSKTSKVCWALLEKKDKLISNILLWIPVHQYTCVCWQAKTYIHHLCVDIGCCLENLPRAIEMDGTRRERERERKSQGNPYC